MDDVVHQRHHQECAMLHNRQNILKNSHKYNAF